uniref:Xrn1 N-terminal domain-containing protein n=1 Tax=viral metagenome TaxID=1070528 RepID=A0A6C0EJU0_9ZZZZ
MGIKHFFTWFKRTFADDICKLKRGETFEDLQEETILDESVIIDNLMIDMNGLFHTSAQKIYQYGEYKPQQRLLGKRCPPKRGSLQMQINCFKDVCNSIDKCLNIVKPRKRLILCVDGPAPLSKQNQQRQRRFVSAIELEKDKTRSFDSNCLTPGTKFMDYLTKYIDWYIRKKMSEPNSLWTDIEVIFSNEKAPGEGEHKLINFIRHHGSPDESYCIHGMDADLIMLSLGTHMPKFYILREEPRDPNFEFHVIDIGGVRRALCDKMSWGEGKFYGRSAINDFIFMCFTVGNDFLPHIPGVEIIEGGIDFMLDVYRTVCREYGHLTRDNGRVVFRKKALVAFMGTLSQYEKGVLEDKLKHKGEFFPDPLLEDNAEMVVEDGKVRYELDIEQYRDDYYRANLSECKELESLCHDYLEGMQWVLEYYTRGVPNWRWRFPHHYAPFAYTIAEHIKTFKFSVYGQTIPTVPFVQLLSVLPPASAHLLPFPLDKLLATKNSPISEYYPENFGIDLSGKRREWEGTVLLPMIDYNKVEREYYNRIQQVDQKERRRNILGKSFVYNRHPDMCFFRSYYGDFQSNVSTEVIEL